MKINTHDRCLENPISIRIRRESLLWRMVSDDDKLLSRSLGNGGLSSMTEFIRDDDQDN